MHSDLDEALEGLAAEGWIARVLGEVKQGKEAAVYRCAGGPRAPGRTIAAKVYRSGAPRRFRQDATYLAGRKQFAHDTRVSRALASGSSFGRKVEIILWLEHEWETLCLLHRAGASVPEPLARGSRAILMSFVGDSAAAAPRLADVEPGRDEAAAIVDGLLAQIELMLDCHRVHGDLSPYNVLLRGDEIVIIDFPQAVDPRLNPSAPALLARDVEQVCRWAARRGAERQASRITADLWERFIHGDLG